MFSCLTPSRSVYIISRTCLSSDTSLVDLCAFVCELVIVENIADVMKIKLDADV